MAKISIDRTLKVVPVIDPSDSDASLRPELAFSAYFPPLLQVDVELEFRSIPINGKYLKKLIRLTKRRLKSQTWKANKDPLIESLFQKIQTDHKDKR